MASQRATEETPLLPETAGAEVHRPNRISRLQIGLILLVSLAENLSPQVLYPFMPDLVANLDITHGDASKVSFYMGVERALFFTTLSLTTLTWNRASDRLGRKPILLAGSGGAALSLYATGLTRRSYRWLIVSRCFGGFFNGNVGILKSIMAEMSADSNQLAELFSYLPLAWAGTGLFGPLIGGSLARPAEQFPRLFGSNKFLKAYPYFLPCAVNASFLVFACVMCYTFLKETLKNPESFRQWLGLSSSKNSAQTPQTSGEDAAERAGTPVDPIPESERPYPILGLLRTRRVLIVAINFTCLSISQASLNTFQPLQLSLPVDKGGMNFAPPLVGKILSTFGLLNGALQFFFFAKIHAYMGPKWFFTVGTACGIPMIMSFPLTNYLVRSSGNTGPGVWALIAVQTLAKVGINMSSGALFIVVAAAAPNKASLGATMGICSTIGSLMRAYGPAMTNTIFAISLEKNILAGNLVYIFLFITTSITLVTASFLPRQL